MHATDIVAYVGDGEILCPDCGTPDDHPIFADGDLRPGETCGSCGAFTQADGEWSAPRGTPAYDAALADSRWLTCAKCNHQEPGENTARDRHASRLGQIVCSNCHGPMHY